MSTVPPNDFQLIESIVNQMAPKAQEDARSLFQGWSKQIATVSQTVGVTQGANPQNTAVPPQAALAVSAVNAAVNVTITPPELPQPATLWHEVSYSTIKGFTSGVTTLEPTTSTSLVLNLPSFTGFFRLRSSLNKQVWNNYVLHGQTAVSSGLVSSAATNDSGAFNQTNLGIVTSVAIGATAAVQVQGAGAPLSSMVTLQGQKQSIFPGATIIGVAPGSTQFVGAIIDPFPKIPRYLLRPTLGSLIDDGITPVGVVSVVTTGTPTPPTIVPIFGAGGSIIGYNVTFGGVGAVAPYTLTLGSVGGGTGATFGDQTIVAGVLESVAPGNPGSGYSGGTTVTATGGDIAPGSSGGGTARANNQGRLISAYS
jgi:hypothetical protein